VAALPLRRPSTIEFLVSTQNGASAADGWEAAENRATLTQTNTSRKYTWGLLDRSTALYFYKRLKTSLHKPRGNLLENLFYKKCAFKNNLQLFEKKVLSQTNTTPKNGILLSKMAHFQVSSIFQ
jgi:hypothetical protein